MSQQVILVNPVGGNQGRSEWSHGLFGCFDDCGECLLACCCPCITFGLNARDSGCCCDGCCGAFCGCLFFFCPFSLCAWCCCIRPNIRRNHRIPTNCCADLLAIMCCPCCALIQERKQCKTSTTQVVEVVVQNTVTQAPSSYIPPQQYAIGPPQQYAAGHPQQYAADPPKQYAAGPGPSQQYAPQPLQQYPPGPPQQYAPRPLQQYPPGPPQQYAPQPLQQYPPGPPQMYMFDGEQFAPDAAGPPQQYAPDAQQYKPEAPPPYTPSAPTV